MTLPSKAYFADTVLGVYYTTTFTNATPTWAAINTGLPATDIRLFALDPFTPDTKQYVLLEATRDLYRRDNAGSWAAILTSAAAQALTTQDTSGSIRCFRLDESLAGRMWVLWSGAYAGGYQTIYAMYSSDWGATWTAKLVEESSTNSRVGYDLSACGDNVWINGDANVGLTCYYSANKGVSWAAGGSTDDWGNVNKLQPTKVHYTDSSGDHKTIDNAGSVAAASNPGPFGSNTMWFSRVLAGHQRIVSGGKIYSTYDSWATVNTPSAISPVPVAIARRTSDDESDMIVGLTIDAGNPHGIGVLYGESDTTATGKAGAMCDTAPYTDSIPNNGGGVAWDGVAGVYEVPAFPSTKGGQWITVKTAAGVTVGSGPIVTASAWNYESRVDEAGSFSFEMPTSDSQWLLLQSHYIVECYGILQGAITLVGTGVVEQIEVMPGAPSMVRISGPNLLGELARYPVGDLSISEHDWTYMDGGKGAVRWIDGMGISAERDLPEAYDGDPATFTTPKFDLGDHWWLYIGYDMPFRQARFKFKVVGTGGSANNQYQYFSQSTGWTNFAGLTDGTAVGADILRQDGDISWTMPTDWARNTPTAGAGSWFWMRIRTDSTALGTTINDIQLYEISIDADKPTTTGVEIITTIANTLSGGAWPVIATATTTAVYMSFAGESVLTALQALAKTTGDHFIIPLGTTRTITWLGAASTWAASGYRAIGGVTGIGAEGNNEAVLISAASEIKDTQGVVGRIIPFAGTGSVRIDIAATSKSAPAGYTLNKTPTAPMQPYLENDAAMLDVFTARVMHFDNIEINNNGSLSLGPGYAADCLFDAALNYLKTHCIASYAYELTVENLWTLLEPGKTIHVVYQEWTDGVLTLDINTYPSSPLYVMAVSYSTDERGVTTCGLEVSNVERQPETGAAAVVNNIKTTKQLALAVTPTSSVMSNYQTIISDFVDINGGTIDGAVIGADNPKAATFTGVTLTGNLTVPDGGTIGQVAGPLLTFDDTLDQLRITGAPGGLTLSGDDATQRLLITNTTSTVVRFPGVVVTNYKNGTTGYPYWSLINYEGTLAAPLILPPDSRVGIFAFSASVGATYKQVARISVTTGAAFSTTEYGSIIDFMVGRGTTEATSIPTTSVMRLVAGWAGMGYADTLPAYELNTPSSPKLGVKGNADVTQMLSARTVKSNAANLSGGYAEQVGAAKQSETPRFTVSNHAPLNPRIGDMWLEIT